jgi:hypothetical protein
MVGNRIGREVFKLMGALSKDIFLFLPPPGTKLSGGGKGLTKGDVGLNMRLTSTSACPPLEGEGGGIIT